MLYPKHYTGSLNTVEETFYNLRLQCQKIKLISVDQTVNGTNWTKRSHKTSIQSIRYIQPIDIICTTDPCRRLTEGYSDVWHAEYRKHCGHDHGHGGKV